MSRVTPGTGEYLEETIHHIPWNQAAVIDFCNALGLNLSDTTLIRGFTISTVDKDDQVRLIRQDHP
jgi:hypothetical protein